MSSQQFLELLAQIKAAYDAPSTFEDYEREFALNSYHARCMYCVGGAVCQGLTGEFSKLKADPIVSLDETDWEGDADLHYGQEFRFPGYDLLGVVLEKANSHLDINKAVLFACKIVDANDRSDFAAAWAVVEEALTYTGDSNE